MQSTGKLPDIKKTILIKADIQKVWDTVSTSEGISNWFMPNNFKAELGSEFFLQSPFGPSPCKVLEINPPYKLSFSWDESGWVVSFELKEVGNQTEFTLTHSGWKSSDEILPKVNQKSSIVHDNMSNGWEAIVNKLGRFLNNL